MVSLLTARYENVSMGNVISPEDVLKTYGADILGVWASASDYAEDLRIDKNILIQHAQVL